MAFASIGGKFETASHTTAQFVRIHGQIYHNISALHPQTNNDRRYGQIYILDSDDALNERLKQLNQQSSNTSYFQYTPTEIGHMTEV